MMLQIFGWFSFLWGVLVFLIVTRIKAKEFPHLLTKPIMMCAIPLFWIVAAICWSHP